jgi:hypothetical protein
MLSFKLDPDNPNHTDVPQCESGIWEDSPECDAQYYYGSWFDSRALPKNETADSLCGRFESSLVKMFGGPNWFTGLMAEKCVYRNGVHIESLMLCPSPHWFSSGSHRAMIVAWRGGERYVIAVEEGALDDGYNENLFVQSLTKGKAPGHAEARSVLNSVIEKIFGYKLDGRAHRFRIKTYPAPQVMFSFWGLNIYYPDLLAQGCTPSNLIDEY